MDNASGQLSSGRAQMTHGLAFGVVQGEGLLEGCVGFLVGDKVGQEESADFPK